MAVAVPPGEPRTGVLAALDRANRRYLEAYRANSVIWALAEQVATMDEEIHRIRLRGRIEHVERVAKTIRRWQDHGLADRDIDPRTTAGALVSMLSNFAYWWLAGGDSYDPETAAATLTAIWARAVGLAERSEQPPAALSTTRFVGHYHLTACHPLPGTLLLVDIDVDYDAVMPETRKTFGDVSVWPSGDLVATVEIGRPPDNFFDAELITSLADACAWLDEQPEFRAAVLCSDGKHFCAGADFTGRSGRTGMGGAKELYAAAARLFEARTPVVAAVQGAAVGGGLGLACAADFRVASPQARFCANFARLGLHHGFALTVTLPAIVGEQRALDLLCTGRRVGGEEAARIGLADRLAEPEGLPASRAGAGRRDRRRRPARGAVDPGDDARDAGGPGPGGDGPGTGGAGPAAADGGLRRGHPRVRAAAASPIRGAVTMAVPDAAGVLAELRRWIEASWDPELSLVRWRELLADAGWACPAWPRGWCGRSLPAGLAALVRRSWPVRACPARPKGSAWAWPGRCSSSTAPMRSGNGSSGVPSPARSPGASCSANQLRARTWPG